MTATTPTIGSAGRNGPSWDARAHAWAENELQQLPTYEEALRRLAVEPGQDVLEVGCGSGVFLRAAADQGARPTGLDAAPALIELARARVPEADLYVGDMQFLPFKDDRFDVVAGFNSFFFAADMVEALREAGRVAKPSAPVLIQVWGRAEHCDLTAMLRAVAPLRPAPPPGTPTPPTLSDPGVLEQIASAAGLTPETASDVSYEIDFPDERTLVKRMLSPGPIGEAIEVSGEETVARAIVDSLVAHRKPDGGYRLRNEWHYLVARA
jgi:SAM-dependent methyltransferase